MIAMGSFRNKEMKEYVDAELYRLSKYFTALNVDHQKGVLKTARGLLRIQRAQKMMTADNTRYFASFLQR
jgi:hypothetical protein